ncbi:MAG: hypothetical protein HOV68_26135 [Streptomycetaceae bacterium]|nr:hypothetical protein [Streptomycetaceae bacterium]
MEPISAALLGAIARGAGGDAGHEAWAALRALVRRPSPRSGTSGDAALTALEGAPDDPVRAEVVSQVLSARAHTDPEFGDELAEWARKAAKAASTPG